LLSILLLTVVAGQERLFVQDIRGYYYDNAGEAHEFSRGTSCLSACEGELYPGGGSPAPEVAVEVSCVS